MYPSENLIKSGTQEKKSINRSSLISSAQNKNKTLGTLQIFISNQYLRRCDNFSASEVKWKLHVLSSL